ncbi:MULTISPECIES: hypothetical protein [Lysobacter]|uniref:hypothetical protein n=1 Tax=Lysobacter TaxID=68 RepID=UPI001F297E06|nr:MULTISPECIES: hypothetical protein [Lysobacter]UJB19198.1 hypothetical protein L1A79_23280 [Lysobacter capsici]UJQ27077.1 hypothetical protein L2D09_16605 [Lysobacter gummosus]
MPSYTPWIAFFGAVIGSLGGVLLASLLTRGRDKAAQAEQDRRDSAHLVGLVVPMLERFCQGCDAVAHDEGEYEGPPGEQTELAPQATTPDFVIDALKVEWKALPADLMFDVLALPGRVDQANRIIAGAAHHDDGPDYSDFFNQRRYQYAVLGIDAAHLAARLRSHAGIASAEANLDWDAPKEMEAVKRLIEKRWATPARFPDF